MNDASDQRSEAARPAADEPASSGVDAPEAHDASAGGAPVAGPRFGHRRRGAPQPVLYPNAYVWFVFLSSLDVMLTWTILKRDGTEVNPIARSVIDLWGLNGAIVFKFTLMVFVIVVCEVVGRRRPAAGRRLIRLCVFVSALPVTWSLLLLLLHTYGFTEV